MGARRSKGPAVPVVLAREWGRALGGGLLLPWRVSDFLYCRESWAARLRADLETVAEPQEAPPAELPERPLRVALSCAEASGETHAVHLARALRTLAERAGAPPPELRGLGGERLRAAGVETIADPVARAEMGFGGVLARVPYYGGLVADTARLLADWRPDVFVPVDSPALHVPLAHVAQSYGVPVAHFVTPQYWGWAPWRVRGYRRAVDRALSILPFEPAWFAREGVPVAHVGHPLLDALADVPRRRPGADGEELLAILPGSRAGVVRRNLPWMLAVVAPLVRARPGLRARVLQEDERHAPLVRAALAAFPGLATLVVGDLHAELARARAAFTVSGTVLLDLLHHRLPAVVVYRLAGRSATWMSRHLVATPWFSSVNLLAGRAVLPEFCFAGAGPRAEVAAALERCLRDERWRQECTAGLERAADRLGPPGATQRAAGWALATAAERRAAGPEPGAP